MRNELNTVDNNITYNHCPLCLSPAIAKIGDITYPNPLTFSTSSITMMHAPELWSCSNCRSWFTQNILPRETAEKLYHTGISREKWPVSYDFSATKPAELSDALRRLFMGKSKVKVLDIGCNTGELLDYAKEFGCLTFGVELSEQSREVLKSKGHTCYSTIDEIAGETFDVIVAFDLIEHLHEPRQFLFQSSALLQKGGTLVLLTGNNSCFSALFSRERWWYVAFPEHIVFPSLAYLSSFDSMPLESCLPVFNTRDHDHSFITRITAFIKGVAKGSYTGTPSLVADHLLTVLRKSDACTICGSTDAFISYNVYDDRFAFPGNFVITTCRNCTHRQLAADFTPEMIGRLYTEYYPRSSFDLDNFKPFAPPLGIHAWLNGDYASAFRWVPEHVRVLDIGCGFGETLWYHTQRGCEAYGVEADENIKRVADKFGYKVHVGLFDPGLYEGDFFDYITLDQVMEHTLDPIGTLQGINRILKPGGTVIISTPNAEGWGMKLFGRRWIHWHTPYHLQFFTKKSLVSAARSAGLAMKSRKTITSAEWLYYQWIHLVTMPTMGTPSPFWLPQPNKSLKFRLVMMLLKLIHRTKINHFITRLFDVLGFGDNSIYFLTK